MAFLLLNQAAKRLVDVDRIVEEGKREFKSLMAEPESQRLLKITGSAGRFRNPHLAEMLVEESRMAARESPTAALALIECARTVALRLPHDLYSRGWAVSSLVRAEAYRGNALRLIEDLAGAAHHLEFAWSLFDREGDGDPHVEGEILSLLSSVRRDQRRLSEAASLLDRALTIFREIEEPDLVARVLVKQVLIYVEQGDTSEAVQAAEQALRLLQGQEKTHLYLCAVHNLVLALEESGQYARARELLLASEPLFRRFADSGTQLRYAWSLGTTARGLGQLEDAEQRLAGVRESFLRHGCEYDAALVGLDLALVLLLQGRHAELKDLSAELVDAFLRVGVRQEAAAAMHLFTEGIRAEALTRSWLWG